MVSKREVKNKMLTNMSNNLDLMSELDPTSEEYGKAATNVNKDAQSYKEMDNTGFHINPNYLVQIGAGAALLTLYCVYTDTKILDSRPFVFLSKLIGLNVNVKAY